MEKSEKQKRQEELNHKRAKSICGYTNHHTNSSININKYKLDNSPQAQHAREYGATKPYYLIIKEKAEARKAAAEAAKQENN